MTYTTTPRAQEVAEILDKIHAEDERGYDITREEIEQAESVDYGIHLGRRILAIQLEHAEFDARKKRETEQVYENMCRYFGWAQIVPPKVTFCTPGGVPQDIEIPIGEKTL